MINAIHVTPAGAAWNVEIEGLEHMQNIVCGYIEFVSVPDEDYEVIVNDEGLIQNLEVNALASVLAGQRLVGPVLFVGKTDNKGNTTSVPKGTMTRLHQASMIMDLADRPAGHPSWEQVR